MEVKETFEDLETIYKLREQQGVEQNLMLYNPTIITNQPSTLTPLETHASMATLAMSQKRKANDGYSTDHHYLMLDTGAEINMVSARSLCSRTRISSIVIKDANGNAKPYAEEGYIPCFGVWGYICEEGTHPYTILGNNSLKNSFSFIENDIKVITENGMQKKIIVGCKYEHCAEKFTLHFEHREYLNPMSRGLLLAKVPVDTATSILEAHVNNNTSTVSKKDQEKAKEAWDLWKNTGFMEKSVFIKMLKEGIIQEKGGVSRQDFENAIALFGTAPYVSGRAKIRKIGIPPVDMRDEEYVGHKREPQSISSDLFFVSGLTFLLSVASPSNHGLVTLLESKETIPVRESLKLHIMKYRSLGFTVEKVEFDGESATKDNDQVAAYIGCKFTSRPVDVHAVKAERRIQTVRDRMRSLLAALDFTAPRSIIQFLVTRAMIISNWEPTHSRSSKVGISSNEIVYGRKAIANQDFKWSFGEYVQTTKPRGTSHSSLDDRTEQCIALYPDGEGTGWHYLKLDTWESVHRSHGVKQPMPAIVKQAINDRAVKETAARKAILDVIKSKKENKKKLSKAEELVIVDDGFVTRGGEIPETQQKDDILTPPQEAVRGEGKDDPPPTIGTPEAPGIETRTAPVITPTNHVENLILEEDHEGEDENKTGEELAAARAATARAARILTSTLPVKIRDLVPIGHGWDEVAQANALVTTDPKIIRKRFRRTVDALANRFAQLVAIEEAKEAAVKRQSRIGRGKNKKFATACALEAVNVALPQSKAEASKNMTLKEATAELGSEAPLEATKQEIMQIVDMGVLNPIYAMHMTKEDRWNTLRTKLFVKVKYLASGTLDKVKARLVAGGDDELKSSYDPNTLWSPTVALPSTFLTLGIAALHKQSMAVLDIKAAYLCEPLVEGSAIRVKLNKECTSILLDLYPEMAKYVDPKEGVFYSWLERSLYGIISASSSLFKGIRELLKKLGFKQNAKDDCCFTRRENAAKPAEEERIVSVNIYVDDLLICGSDDDIVEKFISEFRTGYKDVTVKRGPTLSYLGMELEHHKDGKIKLSMRGYIDKMRKNWDALNPNDLAQNMKKSTEPMDPQLFTMEEDSPLISETKREEFHSLVGVLTFLVKRARVDCSTPLAFLAGRVRSPTESDWGKMRKLLSYLFNTRDRALVLEPKSTALEGYIDASYGSHADRKSHSGTLLTMAGMPFMVKSSKQKLVAKSSCEAEIVALSDATGWIIWAHQWMKEQGYPPPKVTIWEDNESVIKLITKGKPASDSSRHFQIRYFYLKNLIDEDIVDLRHLRSEDMTADVLSKGTTKEVFRTLTEKMMTSQSDL